MLQATQLQEHLCVLTQNPDSRLLLQSQKGWIVLHSFDISTRILCEIATNQHLEKEFHLSDEQIQIFEEKKYFKRREGTSRGRLLTINSNNNQKFCEELLFIASCYEPDVNNWKVSFTRACRHNLKNSKISGQMKILSKKRDYSSRTQLYQYLLNSELLLYMDGTIPKVIGNIGKFDSYALFTEDKYYYHYDPRGVDVVRKYGHEIFFELHELKAGSVWINPKGLVGGELYQNEIEMLAKAMYRR
jgi:hypothetical protein